VLLLLGGLAKSESKAAPKAISFWRIP
jgi:hypothetical protein